MADPTVPRLATHATLHLARFADVVTLDPDDLGHRGGTAVAWIAGADNVAAGTPSTSPTASVWVGLGLHADERSATELFAAGTAAVPWSAGAAEHWVGLLAPMAHRGEVDWVDPLVPGPAFETATRRPTGPFVAVTSVGWILDERFDPTRVADFDIGVERVRAGMDDVDGLGAHHGFDVHGSSADGFTVTFWRDDTALRAFAYRPGEHQRQVDRFRALGTADRTSFTRFEVLDHRGTWRGGDPLAW